MMLIKLFIFFLLLLILPDWYISELISIVYHKNGFAGLIGYQHYSWSQG